MAFGNETFSNAGAAVSDLYAAAGHRTKAAGQRIEAGMYRSAASMALENAEFSRHSTAIKETQQEREAYKIIGGEEAAIAGGGGAFSGSALDILRDSTSQAALHHALIHEQGQITEHGYQQQASSYNALASAADLAAGAEDKAAKGSKIAGAIHGTAAGFTLAGLFV